MTADDLRRLYHTEPFEPFYLQLRDGREVLVAKRTHMAISPTNRRIAVAPFIEDLDLIAVSDITGVRPARLVSAAIAERHL